MDEIFLFSQLDENVILSNSLTSNSNNFSYYKNILTSQQQKLLEEALLLSIPKKC